MPIPEKTATRVAAFVENHREQLIKAVVQDSESQKQLLALSTAIAKLKARDPSLVAAWGLGCGQNCAAQTTDIRTLPLDLGG
jgi:hypothetical protein